MDLGTWKDDEDKIERLTKKLHDARQDIQSWETKFKDKEWDYHTLRRLIYNAITHHNNDLTHIISENCSLFEKLMKDATDRRFTDQTNAGNALLNKVETLKHNVRQIEHLGGNTDVIKKDIEDLIQQCKIITDSDPHNTELY